jgi:hypothetical protein
VTCVDPVAVENIAVAAGEAASKATFNLTLCLGQLDLRDQSDLNACPVFCACISGSVER